MFGEYIRPKSGLKILKLLTYKFGLTREDMLDSSILKYSCQGGRLNIVQWVVKYFDLPITSINDNHYITPVTRKIFDWLLTYFACDVNLLSKYAKIKFE